MIGSLALTRKGAPLSAGQRFEESFLLGKTNKGGEKPWTQCQVAAILGRHTFYREGFLRYGEAMGIDKNLVLLSDEKES